MAKPPFAPSACVLMLVLSLTGCTNAPEPANRIDPAGFVGAGVYGLIGGAANAVGFLIAPGPGTVLGPVAVTMPDGEILRGTASSVLAGPILLGEKLATADEFAVRGGMLECRGRSDSELGNAAVSVMLGCSDGRSGVGRVVRENEVSGSGNIHMNDGSEASFLYGEAASGI